MRAALPIHDARRIPSGAVLEYDVCIVGTGAAGTSAALELAGRGLRMAILESGGLSPDEATTELLALECTDALVPTDSRERWLGGTTNAWTGGKTTLDDIDLARRPWVPHSGWPMDAAQLRRCYSRAAELLGRPGPELYDASPASADDGLVFDTADLRTIVFHEDAEPLRFGELLRQRLGPADGVDLFTLSNVTDLRLDEAGTQVAGVDIATLTGRRFQLNAGVVLLACGAIENARLLLASRARRPAGLGNQHDLVGRYFQDHPKGFTGVIAVEPSASRLPASHYWAGRRAERGYIRWGVGLSASAQERAEVLNSYVRLEPVVLDTLPPGIAALRSARRLRLRNLDPRRFASVASERTELARLARFRLRNEGPIDAIQVRSFLEQEPRLENRVRLSEHRDRFGAPLAAVDWSVSDLDRRSVRVLHEMLAVEVRNQGIGELHAELDDGAEAWTSMIDASHHAGTTRMGADPRTSVTDPCGQVHDVGGLFVAGASLFPTSGYANPVFTIAATALHVADHMAAHLDPVPVAVSTGPADLRPTAAGKDEVKRWLKTRLRLRRPLPDASRGLAVAWSAPGVAELVPVEVNGPVHGDVAVLVEASAVSPGTERARWLRLPGASVRFPHRPGYSLSGIVTHCGPGVHDLEPGARVAVWGAPHQSLVTVSRADVQPIAGDADLGEAALVTLGSIAALGVARSGGVTGRSVAVIGAGPIGLLAQRLAAAAGAASSSVVAASTAKDAVARGDGTIRLCPPAEVDGIGAEVVIEATGTGDGLELALRAARPCATVVLLGTTRGERVIFALDLVQERGLRVVGAHGGLLDTTAGIDGIDRRSAAELFLQRWQAGEIAVGDLITHRIDPRDVAGLYEHLATDRTVVVPLLEWWRLPDELRVRNGPQVLPNPARRGFGAGWGAMPWPAPSGPPAVDHPDPPARATLLRSQWSDERRAEAVSATVDGLGPDRRVRVTGHGPLAERVRGLLDGHSTASDDDAAAVVVETAPTAASVQQALGSLGPAGTLVVAGPAGPVELDVQTLIHQRGTTLLGAPTDVGQQPS